MNGNAKVTMGTSWSPSAHPGLSVFTMAAQGTISQMDVSGTPRCPARLPDCLGTSGVGPARMTHQGGNRVIQARFGRHRIRVGYQDTSYTHQGTQYFRNCNVSGNDPASARSLEYQSGGAGPS